jgi:hypothetical protein
VRHESLAKVSGVGRERAAFVPVRAQRLTHRFAPVSYVNDSKPKAVGWEYGWHDRHAVSSLGERQQALWRAALDESFRFKPGETAGRIECFANHVETGVREQQWIRGKLDDVDVSGAPKLKRGVAGGEKVDRRQRKAFEGMVVALYRPHQADSDVNLAALQQGKQVRAHSFGRPDLYVRSLFGVLVQECGKDALQHLRRYRNLQDACVSLLQPLSSLAERSDCAKNGPAISEQLLALASQNQAAANAIEQPQAELFLELLSRTTPIRSACVRRSSESGMRVVIPRSLSEY